MSKPKELSTEQKSLLIIDKTYSKTSNNTKTVALTQIVRLSSAIISLIPMLKSSL